MCGIAGVIGWDACKEEQVPILKSIQDTLTRRGPDQQGIYTNEGAALIQTTLTTADSIKSGQPMEFKTMDYANYVLVYSGKLYNTKELRDELIALGHELEGNSDTEMILHAYFQWKENCLKRLNGVFAFGIWEEHNRRLFLARDYNGVKPLFYARKKAFQRIQR